MSGSQVLRPVIHARLPELKASFRKRNKRKVNPFYVLRSHRIYLDGFDSGYWWAEEFVRDQTSLYIPSSYYGPSDSDRLLADKDKMRWYRGWQDGFAQQKSEGRRVTVQDRIRALGGLKI